MNPAIPPSLSVSELGEQAGVWNVARYGVGVRKLTPTYALRAVRSAPALILFKQGKVQATQMGLVSKAQLVKLIDAAL